MTMATAIVSALRESDGARRRGDDRGNYPERPGAACRRHPGKGAGRAASRNNDLHPARRNKPDMAELPPEVRRRNAVCPCGDPGGGAEGCAAPADKQIGSFPDECAYLAGTVTALLAVAGSAASSPESGTIAGKVTLTAAVRGAPLASNAYQPRAVGRHEPGRTPEIQNVVVYLKGVDFKGALPASRQVSGAGERSFVPRVIVVTRGSVVEFPNGDPYLPQRVFPVACGHVRSRTLPQGQTREEHSRKRASSRSTATFIRT